jgi:hypothetical protein
MATDYQLTESFQKNKSDYIRPGEYIKIVAINRATGYMGTARVQLARSNLGDLTVLAPPIVLSPPHLKIWAERKYNVEQGITQGEARNYTIGTEGAALTSDTTITIYTEWLDEHGKPLPEELGLDNGEQYGFTGRLARVVAPNQLQGENSGSDLASFAIAPGRKTQVIKVGSNLTTAEHYYVHVIGKGKDQECSGAGSCPSFTSLGFNAPYNHRPNLLVPFLVPLPDEDLTWQEYNNYRGLLADDTVINKPNKPLPAYSWAYRPEYQFSQYGLKMQGIKATDASGTATNTNLLTSDSPVISSGDDYITAFYSLISSSFDRLTAIDGKQELVLALGEQEQVVTIGEDQSITFSNLEHLAQLNPEDFLTMRLYTNNDTSNILWEWAFTTMDIDIDSDNNNGLDEPDRSLAEEEIEGAENYSGKIIAINDGDINGNDIPDFAEFKYLDENANKVDLRFVPIIFEIPPHVNIAEATLTFIYSASNPTAVTSVNKGTADAPQIEYTPTTGYQRLWLVNADETRRPETITHHGHYIAPNVKYTLNDLGFSSFVRNKTFYIEGIAKSEAGEAQIQTVLEYEI